MWIIVNLKGWLCPSQGVDHALVNHNGRHFFHPQSTRHVYRRSCHADHDSSLSAPGTDPQEVRHARSRGRQCLCSFLLVRSARRHQILRPVHGRPPSRGQQLDPLAGGEHPAPINLPSGRGVTQSSLAAPGAAQRRVHAIATQLPKRKRSGTRRTSPASVRKGR